MSMSPRNKLAWLGFAPLLEGVTAARAPQLGAVSGCVAQRLATWVDAACATVETVLIDTTAPSATNAAKIASRIRELR